MKKIFIFIVLSFFLNGCMSFGAQPPESPRLDFINAAYKYLKTPYKYAGTTKEGMDCSGFIYRSALDGLEMTIPRTTKGLAGFVKHISNKEVQPGDLLFFHTVGNKLSHVGIYIGNRQFIHAASQGKHTGVIVSSLDEKYWKKSIPLCREIFRRRRYL
ncbi:C40 family peptidase [Treponema sp. OMZ 788]|uniref:C40 family peptidase n=1 Tax=Treponema sp. OMZ 788 TaxID=2563664 RepID=UPI0020A52F57|nr:C40 family peptidase [Treponema sp. OMZ 788]